MNNMEKFRSILGEKADGLLLTSRYARYYGASFDIAEGVAIVSAKGSRYFTDSRYIESAQKNLQNFEVIETNREHPYNQLLNQAIADFGITNLGFEEDYLTMAEYMGYEKALNAKLVPMNAAIHSFRAVKEPWELEIMRKAQDITDAAFSDVVKRIHAGMSEKDLQAELIYCLYKNGAEGLSFDPIVVSGPNTSMPHGVAGDRKLQDGDFITMDFGVLYKGYCSDMTRTVALGYATEEMKKVYATVLEAQLAGIAVTKAGVTGQSIDGAARKVIADAGYGAYFGHGYGHCLGLEIHESPRCSLAGTTVMEENMVSSAEPGIYLPGKFGVRIEDVVFFGKDGCEDITHSPKNLMIL